MSEFNRLDAIGENRAWEMEISTMEEAEPTQLTLDGVPFERDREAFSGSPARSLHNTEEVRRVREAIVLRLGVLVSVMRYHHSFIVSPVQRCGTGN